MLVGLFWQVQHAAIYKPAEQMMHNVREPSMRRRQMEVVKALAEFEDEWSRLTADEDED